jgi:nucleoside-diphosphate-sugar epimerase
MIRLIVGCGYLGRRVADRWLAGGDQVHVLTRSDYRAERLAGQGLLPVVGDVTSRASLNGFPRVDTLLWAVGHDRQAGPSIEEVYVEGLRNALSALDNDTRRLIYISSTGVYGQRDGGWVDERSPTEPIRRGGRACRAAEQVLLQSSWADRTVILRLAGIYGPGRLPRLRQLRAGQPLDSDPDAVINLIHVEDAAEAVVCAAQRVLQLPATFLIGDGHPVPRRDFYETLAQLAHTEPPRFTTPGAAASDRSRSGSHKRVRNDRMIAELGVSLRYRSYREGLAAVAGSGEFRPG